MHVAHQGGKGLTNSNKRDPDGSQRSICTDTPALPGSNLGVLKDDQTLYVAHKEAPFLTTLCLGHVI